jgi:L-fucose isomerase-like protein
MWDWEINRYLRTEGVQVFAPSSLEQSKILCRTLALKRELRGARLLVFQDNPGDGFQASIFKRFYWWEAECAQRMFDKFGVSIEVRSFRALGQAAMEIPDDEAEAVRRAWEGRLHAGDISERALLSAMKVYLAVRREIEADPTIVATGINCLNESRFSDTTPCLAWNMLYEERGLIWGCEADTVAMLSKLILHRALGVPVMMTNLYPFLMGQAALKHERIPDFPVVAEGPEHHILAAHCGYFGVVPQSFSTEWMLRKKVLAIVDENATAIDARMPEGHVTLAKLDPDFRRWSAAEGMLEGYAQFANSDCLNGAVIRVSDGYRLLDELASHHYILTTGRNLPELRLVSRLFGMEVGAI